MRVVVVTPPSGPIVTVDQAKAHLNIDPADVGDDTLIAAYIAAATSNLDGPGGWLGRALGVQTLEIRLDGFDADPIRLPCPPIAAIGSVKYVDLDGVEQTIDSAKYELLGVELVPVYGVLWPQPRLQREAVRIRYSAGYTANGGTLDPAITAAILLMVGDLYANRETVVAGVRAAAVEIPMSTTVFNLLTPLRIWA